MSPYQPPETKMESAEVVQAQVTGVPRVFGILHLIFGGLGLAMGGVSLVMFFFKSGIQEMQFEAYPENVREGMKAAMQPLYETQKWDVISTFGSMILAVFLIVAGLKLVRYQKQGLKVSNFYSVLSLLHKLFAVLIVVFIKAPVMKRVGESIDRISGEQSAVMGLVMGPLAIGGAVLGVLLMAVYPVLSYVMLNKKASRESLR